jgi:hypothetical protein
MNTRAKLGINDQQRTEMAIAGARGKRLQYKASSQGEEARNH